MLNTSYVFDRLGSMPAAISPRPRYTPNYMLRPFRRRDLNAVDEAITASLSDLARYLPWAVNYSRNTTQHFIRDSAAAWAEARAFDFTIRNAASPDMHLGNISLWWVSRPNLVGEIGYWVRSDYSAQGICTEAAANIVQIGFEELGMHRITLRIAVGNLASERVAAKLGFTNEGLLRDEVKVGADWMDHTIWGLLEHEWTAQKSRYAAEEWV